MKRRSIIPPNVTPHKNPVPMGCIIGNILMTSAIMGYTKGTDNFPTDKNTQIALAFEALSATLVEAGATSDDVIKLDLFFADKSDRVLVNPYWVKMFPDINARPARHSQVMTLPKFCCLQISATAVI